MSGPEGGPKSIADLLHEIVEIAQNAERASLGPWNKPRREQPLPFLLGIDQPQLDTLLKFTGLVSLRHLWNDAKPPAEPARPDTDLETYDMLDDDAIPYVRYVYDGSQPAPPQPPACSACDPLQVHGPAMEFAPPCPFRIRALSQLLAVCLCKGGCPRAAAAHR